MNNKPPLPPLEMEPENDYTSQTFDQRFNLMRKNGKFTDCSFKVDDQIFNVHKLILTGASPVFEAMFYGSLAETERVHIADVKPSVFEAMVDFIYTGRINFKQFLYIEDVLELYYCAQKYMIESLQKICIKYLGSNIKQKNVIKILDLSIGMNLDDITYSCIYVLKLWLASGWSFSNVILTADYQISKHCLKLILQENYDEDYKENLICLLRAWAIVECEQKGLEKSSENMKLLMSDFQIAANLLNEICHGSSVVYRHPVESLSWASYQRIYYRAVRPLIIGDELEFETSFSTNRFIILRSISLNSRLMPQLATCDPNASYTENIFVEVLTKNCEIYNKHHIIDDVEYNTNLEVKLHEHIILYPDVPYHIKIKWGADCLGYEYPRSIFSSYGKSKLFRISFSENNYLESQGSILNGIVCDLYK